MANLMLQPTWNAGVYQFEMTDPVLGGPNGIDNKPLKDLGDRTEYLKQYADQIDDALEGAPNLKDRLNRRGVEPQDTLAKYQYVADKPVAASTGNVDIAAGGLLEIDGVQTQAGNLVFLKDQIDPKENGFWEVQTGAWNRYPGYTGADSDCLTYKFIDVAIGAANVEKLFFLKTDNYQIGVTPLLFEESIFTPCEISGKVTIRDRSGRSRDTETLTQWKKGRNLLDVLRVNSVAEAMDALRARCNDEGDPDFSDLRVGDYLDLPSITIGSNTYPWIDSYQNLRLLLSGFNQYKGAGDTENTKNHVLFTFKNCVLTRRMNASDSNSGGYLSSEMRTFLEGDFKAGLQAALGGNYIQPMRRLMSKKGTWAWETDTVFLPTEREVWGCAVWGEVDYDGGFQGQFPIFRESCEYLLKRYNGARQWWWEGSPSASSAAYFCYVSSAVVASYNTASSVGGVAPAFCVA